MQVGGDCIRNESLLDRGRGVAKPETAGAVTQIKDNATLTCLVHGIVNPTVLVNDGELLGKHMGMYVART